MEQTATWCSHQLICWTHRSVASICMRQSYHSIDVFLNVFDKSFNDVLLLWTRFNQFLNCMIYLFLILTSVWKLQEILLFCPLRYLVDGIIWSLIVNLVLIITSTWEIIFVGIRQSIITIHSHCFSIVESSILYRSFLVHKLWFLKSLSISILRTHLILDLQTSRILFLIFKLSLFFFNQLLDKLLFIDWFFNLVCILVTLLLHNEYRLMISILNKLIFDVFVHHVESIFDIVFGSAWHFLDDFRPLVSNTQPFLKNQNILRQTKWVLLNFWI